jgi:hypothetical protein
VQDWTNYNYEKAVGNSQHHNYSYSYPLLLNHCLNRYLETFLQCGPYVQLEREMVSVHELVMAMELEQEQVFVDCVDCFVGSLVEPV